MPDDRRKLKLDRRKINTGQPHEVAWWTKAFGVTPEQLHAAVAAVGVEVEKVRAYVRLWRATPVPATVAAPVECMDPPRKAPRKRKAARPKAKKR